MKEDHRDLNKNMESINRKMDDSQKNNELLNKKLDDNNKNIELINKNMESLRAGLHLSLIHILYVT